MTECVFCRRPQPELAMGGRGVCHECLGWRAWVTGWTPPPPGPVVDWEFVRPGLAVSRPTPGYRVLVTAAGPLSADDIAGLRSRLDRRMKATLDLRAELPCAWSAVTVSSPAGPLRVRLPGRFDERTWEAVAASLDRFLNYWERLPPGPERSVALGAVALLSGGRAAPWEEFPASGEARNLEGVLAVREGRWSHALELFPSRAEGEHNRRQVWQAQGRLDRAEIRGGGPLGECRTELHRLGLRLQEAGWPAAIPAGWRAVCPASGRPYGYWPRLLWCSHQGEHDCLPRYPRWLPGWGCLGQPEDLPPDPPAAGTPWSPLEARAASLPERAWWVSSARESVRDLVGAAEALPDDPWRPLHALLLGQKADRSRLLEHPPTGRTSRLLQSRLRRARLEAPDLAIVAVVLGERAGASLLGSRRPAAGEELAHALRWCLLSPVLRRRLGTRPLLETARARFYDGCLPEALVLLAAAEAAGLPVGGLRARLAGESDCGDALRQAWEGKLENVEPALRGLVDPRAQLVRIREAARVAEPHVVEVLYRSLHSLNPGWPQAWSCEAAEWRARGQVERARECLQQAHAARPDHVRTLAELGEVERLRVLRPDLTDPVAEILAEPPFPDGPPP